MTSFHKAPKGTPREGYVINPKSGYQIKIGGPTFNRLSTVIQRKLILEAQQGTFAQKMSEKKTRCPPDEVYRVKTRRCIKIGGKTFNSLSLNEKNELLRGKRMEVKSVIGRRKTRTRTRKIPSKMEVPVRRRSPTLYNRRSRRSVSPPRRNVKSHLESLEKGIKEIPAFKEVPMRSPRRSPVRKRSPRLSPTRKRSPRRSPPRSPRRVSPRRSPVRKRSPRRSPTSSPRRISPKVPLKIARSVSKEQINDIFNDISKAGVHLSPEKKREIFSAFGK